MAYNIAQTEGKECCAAQKAKYYTMHQGLYRSDGDKNYDIWTLISQISESNQSSNDNVKTLGLYRNSCETFKTTINSKVNIGTGTTFYYHNNNGLLSYDIYLLRE